VASAGVESCRREMTDSEASEPVPFPELADLHYRWRQALETTLPDLDTRAKRYHDARAAFEAEHGTIVNEYWCWHVPSAVALSRIAAEPSAFAWATTAAA